MYVPILSEYRLFLTRLHSTADAILCLLSYIHFDDEDTIPLTLLSLIDNYLQRYPTQSHDVYPAINIIDALSQSISTCSALSILPIVKALQTGISVWIAAIPELVSDDEYNQHVRISDGLRFASCSN